MTNPISIQFLIVVEEKIEGYTTMLTEQFNNAQSIILLSKEGCMSNYQIDNKECECESFYVDLLFTNMNELKEKIQSFIEPKGIFLENEYGELIEIIHLIKCSIVEVAEHTDFDTILYNTITLNPLEED